MLKVVVVALNFVLIVCVALFGLPGFVCAYMPPPSPCELEPLTYGPPCAPDCAGPPPPPLCNPCVPLRVYPVKMVGPGPCPAIVCWPSPVPTKAAYRVIPKCDAPPPSCAPPPCGPQPIPAGAPIPPCPPARPLYRPTGR